MTGRVPRADGAQVTRGTRRPAGPSTPGDARVEGSGRALLTTRARAFLGTAGVGFGVLTSVVDHGFGPSSEYTSKILGNDWAWLVACFLAALPARTWMPAARRGCTFTWCAVIGYYAADSLAGTYSLAGRGFDAAGVIMDVLFYAIAATVLSLGLGLVIALIHRGGVIGVLARCTVPGFVAYDALSARAALVRSAVIVDPAMLRVSLWIGYAALVSLAGVVALSAIRMRHDRRNRGAGTALTRTLSPARPETVVLRRRGRPLSDDARVLEVIRDRELRETLTPDDVPKLAAFGHRQSIAAVRQSSREALLWGFLAVAVSFDLNGDDREGAMSLPALWHSAGLLGVSVEDVGDFAVRHGASEAAAGKVQAYSRQDHLRVLDYMNLRPSGRGADFDYVRARKPSPPPMP